MAVDVDHHHDSLPSLTKSTRDVVSGASVTSYAARVTGGPYSMQEDSQRSPMLGSSGKKRRPSKPKTGRPLPRSISTPQLRAQVMSDSDADKKRNKLGYQRISIACAHCRRRKIRCLVADGDPQSRCQNCIRLKKECVFYPVEQQSAIENKSQSSKAGGGTGDSSTVSSSPPELGTGRPFDERQDGNGIPILPSNAPSHFTGLPLEPGSAMSSQGSFPPPDYCYSQPPDASWGPQNEIVHHPHAVHPGQIHDVNHHFMRYNHAISPGDVAPFYPDGMHPTSDGYVAQQYQQSQQRIDPYWQPHQPPQALRSMSYDQARSMPNHDPYAVGYHPNPSHHYRQLHPVPLSVEMQSPTMIAVTPGPHSAPIRDYHHAYADHSRPYMLPQEVQTMHSVGARQEFPVQYYQPHPQFAPLNEEASEATYTNQDDRSG